MKLFLKYLKILLKSQLQYRTSFILLCLGQFFIPFFVFAGMYFMFQRFNNIAGWNFYEVMLCFGIIHISFSLSECFARGFDSFSNLIRTGNFDRILVRPRGTIVQVIGSRFEFTRIGRLLQSIIVLIWALTNISIDFDLPKIIILILMIISGIFIFSGIFILAATLCFWTIQSLEIAKILTDGGREMFQYPLGIYKKWVKNFFTFVVPFGCVNYYPLMYLLDKNNSNNILYIISPILGILFIIPCLLVWRIGVGHYKSTGS
ncbi:ABC transporter permease [Vallitalea guaymasensis]|uniref:ABC-2 family transporter protein n=1 Tax=Vallitalea guaymasensis TaxID=1185412 RepID=A0A8J8M760_9FIRM|nr:ABC-2 family transporter protein [Vallitalea guaymasensis]QUH27554.1 ABC-2 family transporter protein [Vallitalea guaymasensis]